MPVKNTTDNLDNTISGGRFSVVFDNTSTPALTALNGTIFTLANTTPVVSVSGPADPLALNTIASIGIKSQAIGAPATQRLVIDWGDAFVTTTSPTTSANHIYTTAGVYSVKATISDMLTSRRQPSSNTSWSTIRTADL